jgi:hypothetical protein
MFGHRLEGNGQANYNHEEMKFLYVPIVFVLILAAACGGPAENKEQERFIKTFRTLKSELGELKAEKLVSWMDKNLQPENLDQQIAEKQRKLDELLGDKGRQANSWNAEVESLIRDGSNIIIRASYGGHFYRLQIFDPRAKKIAEQIKAEDQIVFSGKVGAEASITKTGAALAPEFYFPPTEILWKSAKITQSLSAIRDTNDAQQRQIDQLSKDRAASQEESERGAFVKAECRKVILTKLKYPASGSFSWFKSELIKSSSESWIYSDVISAKNEFGGDLPIRFVCEGKYVKDKLSMTTRLLD